MRKEWILMHLTFFAFIGVNVGITFFSIAPMAVGAIINIGLEMQGLVEMWSTIHMYFAAVLFLQSLHTDMKQPDVWLHSPSSISKLLGVKVAATVVAIFVSLLICGAMAGVAYFVGGFSGIDLFMALQAFVYTLINVLFFIALSLFIWVIYKIMETSMKWFALVILVFMVLIGQILQGFLTVAWDATGLGAAVIYILISLVLYGSGEVLLEKKVRY